MPTLGLGTWKMSDGEAEGAVRAALEIGYRHIDTAKLYGNERGVGNAVRGSGIPREEISVTTKLWPTDFFNPQKAFDQSLSELDIGYIDLYLVHWPVPGMKKSVWRAMEKIYESKKARAIGVSNYGIGELRTLLHPRYGLGTVQQILSDSDVPPAVNQIKFSPFGYEKEILDVCKKNGIVVQAYSPLTRGSNLDDKTVGTIASKYDKTPAQIMLRWCIEHGTVPLPKSSHPERMRENMEIFDFELAPEDIATLDALS
ncbi:MAG TPA: aldo/keto reductase [Candidatus Paceibacterota bacterium]|jgi:diketogulonate reductase-like aldo/keto reductase|nr:aldo/keto reductase [Candidatus Paceibacterota bacterium]